MTDEQLERRIEAHNFRIAALMALCESQPSRRGEYRSRARGLARQVARLVAMRSHATAATVATMGQARKSPLIHSSQKETV